MRWSLPVEVWQEVLAFCPFVEYVHLAGVRAAQEEGTARPASREFYLLLKHSLLEMRFRATLPSACLGGLWIASRTPQASPVRELWFGALVALFSPPSSFHPPTLCPPSFL